MTIDEAIAHAEWAADNCEGECAEEHRQLAEWLKELRERKSTDVALEDERNLLSERLGDYREALRYARAENAKLRDLIFDILVDEERGSTEENTYYEHVRLARELGIGWSR
jgi:hypothetical protein